MSPVTITDVAVGGDGIGHDADGRVVFVRGAVPGDLVEVAVDVERPRYRKGHVGAVIDPSGERVEPPCPHVASGCGGCGWQHIALDAQRRWKLRIVEQALDRLGGVRVPVDPGPVLAPAGRTAVRCLVVDGGAAFRRNHSHDAVVVDSCLVAHPDVDDMIRRGRFGTAAEVVLRVGAATGERLAVLHPGVDDDVEVPDALVVGADELSAGRRAWITDEIADRRWRISADSFFQARADGAEALVAAVRRGGETLWGRGRLVDLYAGVGLFAGSLGGGMKVVAVESNRSSAADARHNLADLDATVVRSRVERWRPSPADIVVADPPRTGLGPAGVEAVAATGASRAVLVSCDAASLGRDARLLGARGYGIVSATLVDQFPHTPHVEVVTTFARAGV